MSKPSTAALPLLVLLGFGSAGAATAIGPELTISERASAEWSSAVAYNPNHEEYLVVWENVWPGGGHDLLAQRVAADGQLLTSFAVAQSDRDQLEPAVAYDPVRDRYLVTWTHDYYGDGSDWDVYGRFVPWNGPSDTLGDFPICTWTSDQAHSKVVYASTAQEFLVVWRNATTTTVPSYISAARIAAVGSGGPPVDDFTVWSGAQPAEFPDVAYDEARNEYLVTWDVERAGAELDIDAIRLSSVGAALGAGAFTVAGWTAIEERPAVAACASADQYLVAWQSDQDTGGVDRAIYARFVDGDGTLGSVHLIDDTTALEEEVDVACNRPGTQYFLAWQTMYAGGYFGIWGRAAFPDQTLGAQLGIVQPGANRHRRVPALDGGRTLFLVTWTHQRTSDGNEDVHGRLVHDDIFADGFESGACGAWSDEVP